MRKAAVLFAAIWLGGGIACEAHADGTIILNKASDFQTAVADGTITGVDINQNVSQPPASPADAQQIASNLALAAAFPELGVSNSGVTKIGSVATANSQLSGLLNSGSPAGGQSGGPPQYVSSWCYGYHIDPDLTDFTINLRVFLPQIQSPGVSGINMVTVALTSVTTNGGNPVYKTRAWGFDNNLTPGILAPDPSTHIQGFRLTPVAGNGAGGSNFFNEESGFDLTKVWYVSIGYRGALGGDYPLTPDSPVGSNAFWTGTQSLTVALTPEPNSALVLACCLLGMGLLRTSLRARTRHRR